MSSLEISVYKLLSSFGNLIFYFSQQKDNKGVLFPHRPIYYLRCRKLTLKYYLNFNSRNLKLKIFILKIEFT